MSDVKIKYFVNSEEKDFPSYADKEWEVVSGYDERNDVYASVLDCSQENTEIANCIYFNGIALPTKYQFKEPFNNYRMPCINLKVKNRKLKLKLDRSDFDDESKIIFNEIIKEIEKIVIDKVIERLRVDKKNFISEEQIIDYTYYNKYINKVPLMFTNKGFYIGITKLSNDAQKPYYNIKINGISRKIEIEKLLPNYIYHANRYENKKSDIAKTVEDYTVTIIPNKYLKEFFMNAENQYTGFKWELMKQIYKELGRQYPNCSTINENWSNHNHNKNEILLPENIIINSHRLLDAGKEIVQNLISNFENCIIGIDFHPQLTDERKFISYDL